jgi:predicted RNase H-like HicB family nuclease
MKDEFTAIIEHNGDWYIAYCPESPGANGQARTKDDARENLAEAIEQFLRTGERMRFVEFRPTRFARPLLSNETEHGAPALAQAESHRKETNRKSPGYGH